MIPGSGRSPGGGNGNPFQYSCLENPHGQRSLAGYSLWGPKSQARLNEHARVKLARLPELSESREHFWRPRRESITRKPSPPGSKPPPPFPETALPSHLLSPLPRLPRWDGNPHLPSLETASPLVLRFRSLEPPWLFIHLRDPETRAGPASSPRFLHPLDP